MQYHNHRWIYRKITIFQNDDNLETLLTECYLWCTYMTLFYLCSRIQICIYIPHDLEHKVVYDLVSAVKWRMIVHTPVRWKPLDGSRSCTFINDTIWSYDSVCALMWNEIADSVDHFLWCDASEWKLQTLKQSQVL